MDIFPWLRLSSRWSQSHLSAAFAWKQIVRLKSEQERAASLYTYGKGHYGSVWETAVDKRITEGHQATDWWREFARRYLTGRNACMGRGRKKETFLSSKQKARWMWYFSWTLCNCWVQDVKYSFRAQRRLAARLVTFSLIHTSLYKTRKPFSKMHKWYTKGGKFLAKRATWHQDSTWMATLPCQPLTHIKHDHCMSAGHCGDGTKDSWDAISTQECWFSFRWRINALL